MKVKNEVNKNIAMENENVNRHDNQSISSWMETATVPDFSHLSINENRDVCIVGAGIAGLTTAYLLGRAGKSVVVVDDGVIVAGETQRTTSHLSNALDDRYFELERLHGTKGASLAAESHTAAIDQIERIVTEEKIDCDFERLDGYLFAAPEDSTELLDRELAAAHRAGLHDVQLVTQSPLASFDTGPALRFPRQAQFHPLKYLAALSQIIIRDGGRIYAHTHVTKIEGGDSARIETEHGTIITADAVVVATNSPVNSLVTMPVKQAAYRTFVIGALVPKNSVTKGLFWDTADPYHYIRLQPLPGGQASSAESDLLIVGGEDHKTGQDDDAEIRYLRLEEWTRKHFPMMTEVKFRWSGQVMEPIDGLAFIGQNPLDEENVYIATGDSGNGMTHGTIAGMLITDIILGNKNPWESLYTPLRITLGAIGEFANETANMVAQYADWFTAGEVEDESAIDPDNGAILRRGLTKVVAYRDDAGHLHEFSAVCPHLEGILAWNHSEKTWDCPCHGSRFDRYGKVLNGPAIDNLSQDE